MEKFGHETNSEVSKRLDLRKALMALGVSLVPMGEAQANATETDLSQIRPIMRSEQAQAVSPFISVESTMYERFEAGSTEFMQEVTNRQIYLSMSDGAIVYSGENRVLGVLPVQEINGINPGAGFDETGHVESGYYSGWRQAVENLASEQLSVPSSEIEVEYNWQDIQSMERVLGQYPSSIFAGVTSLAERNVEGLNQSMIDYLRENFEITNENIPTPLIHELERVMVGIPAEESRFRDGLVSRDGAETVFQFMPGTWEGLGYPPLDSYGEDGPPFSLQVEAFGRHIGNIYNEIHTREVAVALDLIRDLFSSEEDYLVYFLGPTMINAYNTGAGVMRSAILNFLQSDEYYEFQETGYENGYNVFNTMSLGAQASEDGVLDNYQERSRHYTISVLAYAELLNQYYGFSARDQLASLE